MIPGVGIPFFEIMTTTYNMKRQMAENMKQVLETKLLQALGFDKYYRHHPCGLCFNYELGDFWSEEEDYRYDENTEAHQLFKSEEIKEKLRQCILSTGAPTPDTEDILHELHMEITAYSPKCVSDPSAHIDVEVLTYNE